MELIASYDRHERAVGGAAFIGNRPLSFDETGRLRMMSGDDSDGVLAEQSGLPRVLQRLAMTGEEVLLADGNLLHRLRAEQQTVENGKDDEGKPKTKQVTRLREDDVLSIENAAWITAVAANEASIAVGDSARFGNSLEPQPKSSVRLVCC